MRQQLLPQRLSAMLLPLRKFGKGTCYGKHMSGNAANPLYPQCNRI